MKQQEKVINTFYNRRGVSLKGFWKNLWAYAIVETFAPPLWTLAFITFYASFWADDQVSFLFKKSLLLADILLLLTPIILLGHFIYQVHLTDHKSVSFTKNHLLFRPYWFKFSRTLKIPYQSIQYLYHYPHYHKNYLEVGFQNLKGEEDTTATSLVPIGFWYKLSQTQPCFDHIEEFMH